MTTPRDTGLGAGYPADMPRRRLADRLLDSGQAVAAGYANLDRFDPHRPLLGQLIAEALAEHERIGEQRVLDRVAALIEQREQLRGQRIAIARQHLDDCLYAKASSELAWASSLDDQIGALRMLLAGSEPAAESL